MKVAAEGCVKTKVLVGLPGRWVTAIPGRPGIVREELTMLSRWPQLE